MKAIKMAMKAIQIIRLAHQIDLKVRKVRSMDRINWHLKKAKKKINLKLNQ